MRFATFMDLNTKSLAMNRTIEILQELTRQEIKIMDCQLEDIRKDMERNPFPIGYNNLFYLLKDGKISARSQIKMIEHFGYKWELKILNNGKGKKIHKKGD